MANKLYEFGCDVSEGRAVGCKDVIGGINKIFLLNYDADLLSKLTITSNEITDIDSAITIYQYDLRPNTATFNANFTSFHKIIAPIMPIRKRATLGTSNPNIYILHQSHHVSIVYIIT